MTLDGRATRQWRASRRLPENCLRRESELPPTLRLIQLNSVDDQLVQASRHQVAEGEKMARHINPRLKGDDASIEPTSGFFKLGIMYSTDRSVPADLVSAHKWFNLAAMRGNKEAARHRQEIVAEMSTNEIVAAQRAARDWHATH